MTTEHPDIWLLLEYVDLSEFGEAPEHAEALSRATSHLKDCDQCAEEVAKLKALFRDLGDPSIYMEATTSSELTEPLQKYIENARAFAAALASEDTAGLETLQLLEQRPLDEWDAYLREHIRLRTAGLVRQLVERARTFYERNPRQALYVLDIALPIAESLGDDARAISHAAWTHKERANAFRFLSQYDAALEELDLAEALYQRVPVHAFDLAFVEWSRATILFFQTRYADALTHARTAIGIFQQHGSVDYAEQVRVLEAGIVYEQGEVPTALAAWRRSAEIFAEDEQMLARILGNIAECEMRLGDYVAAQRHAVEANVMHRQHRNDAESARTEWIIAHIAVCQGNVAFAERSLPRLRNRFARLGMKLEAAHVSLDCVNVQLQQRDWQAAAHESTRLVAEFSTHGAPVHAADALAYLHEAVRNQSATPTLVEYVRDYVRARVAVKFVPPHDGMHSN